MSEQPTPRTLAGRDLEGRNVCAAGAVDVRRDLHRFLQYVQTKGLLRTRRGNAIPKSAARRLAKLLSYDGEAEAVEEDGAGYWSDHISMLARWLELVEFDTEGEYVGYTSSEPSFVDNHVEVQAEAWERWLERIPIEKDRLVLDAHVATTSREFFDSATLLAGDRFSSWGSGIGPAGRMKLPEIRRGILDELATLEADVWYDLRSVVAWLETRAPNLILDRNAREPSRESVWAQRQWEYEQRGQKKGKRPKKPELVLEDIYTNFREYPSKKDSWTRSKGRQITADTPDGFWRVEGRYLEYFLCEIPYLLGFADLAFRADGDPEGADVWPPLGRLVAFRLTRRFFAVWSNDASFDAVKVTVLPTFEILVEASSYPEHVLEVLAPYTRPIEEDGPITRLALDKKRVVEAAAANPEARPPAEVIAELCGDTPLPDNVAAELDAWCRHGEKLIVYEGFGLLELGGGKAIQKNIRRDIQALTADEAIDGFALVRLAEEAFERLERLEHVPARVRHRRDGFARGPGRLGAASGRAAKKAKAAAAAAPRKVEACLQSEDLVGLRSDSVELLAELSRTLAGDAPTCLLAEEGLLVLSAVALPKLRAVLRRMSDRYEVTMDGVLVQTGRTS